MVSSEASDPSAMASPLMSFTGFIKKASTLLGFTSPEKPSPLDGEIIYCKNNVCVHPPAALSVHLEHHPGYLNVRSQDDQVLGSTLILTWIPNTALKKNPRSIENSPMHARPSPRRSPRQEYAGRSTPTSSSTDDGAGDADRLFCHQRKSGLNSLDAASTDEDVLDKFIVKENNAKYQHRRSSEAEVGRRVNDLHSNIAVGDVIGKGANLTSKLLSPGVRSETSMSSESESPSTEKQLNVLLGNSVKSVPTPNKQRQTSKQRLSSGHSVASVEMDGDHLTVVTENATDSAFVNADDDAQVTAGVSTKTTPSDVVESDSTGTSSDSTYPSPTGDHYNRMLEDLVTANSKAASESTVSASSAANRTSVERLKDSLDLKLLSINVVDKGSPPGGHSHSGASSSSGSTSGPDSRPPSPITPPPYRSVTELGGRSPQCIQNMSFPESSVTYGDSFDGMVHKTAREQVCGVFSVDLGQMRSLRMFYCEEDHTSGQLVIASRESQYKILHFHYGGLDRLASVFEDWTFLAQPKHKRKSESDASCRQFAVIRPYLPEGHSHPEEGAYETVDEDTWRRHTNERGQILDDYQLCKAIFFAGLNPSLRQEMWPFLLHYFPYSSTLEEREQIRNDKFIEYQNVRKLRENMKEEDQQEFWRTVQCTIEKDVVRTDRSHPYFKGDDNPNIEVLKNILLNYATAHPHYGYTQGMSDLLAPVLIEVQNEVDAYWCFVGLMQKTIFVTSPKDIDMDKQLTYLRELLRIILPRFYQHLQKVQDGMELLFCHRWILLCFKREFPEADTLRMWEACWAHYQTDYFHLFIAVALIAVYGEDVIQQDLPADETLLHFSSLSMHMNVHVILKKARGLLHHFRTLRKIPCTLEGLCTRCGAGMWDSGHVPTVECARNHSDDMCPYGGKMPPS